MTPLPKPKVEQLKRIVLASANRAAHNTVLGGRRAAIARASATGAGPSLRVFNSKTTMNKLDTLVQLNAKLDRIIQFQYEDYDRRSMLPTVGAAAGATGLGAAGIYTYGARKQGVKWGNLGRKVTRDIERGGLVGAGGLGSTFMRGAKGIGKAGLGLLSKIRV